MVKLNMSRNVLEIMYVYNNNKYWKIEVWPFQILFENKNEKSTSWHIFKVQLSFSSALKKKKKKVQHGEYNLIDN